MIPPAATEAQYAAGSDDRDLTALDQVPEAIYTCKFPACGRQYASTDGQSAP